MRADRLIAVLLLLQRRGTVTAPEVAEELEVSVRTARRDLEALAGAGVPVYSQAGRGGGWRLIGGATTDLTGLSLDEARALFLAAGAGPTSGPALTSALRKLTSALPDTFQPEAEHVAGAIRVDPSGWGRIGDQTPLPHLDALTDAVVAGRRANLDYESRRSGRSVRLVHPLGLVTKRATWYLVAATGSEGTDGIRTYRVDRVHGVEVLDEPVVRPPDFDLTTAWTDIVSEVAANQAGFPVELRVDCALAAALRFVFGARAELDRAEPGARWRKATVMAQSDLSFAAQIAGFGNRVELLDPPAGVVEHLRRIGGELVRAYGEAG
jgi:predicted DNA-binding transcriptional regulator YafY